ncbi:DUF6278 family protein [Arthrobacter sp. A2-55]|uniref:DUF6278 family protein n=1 Tax=Arthrobacter sp. A2-55 TaxID=2897337 RepID=UPI0021CD9CC2|nr:DUF6278 family protein [Arthrobacter sp. A2-55]MCU6480105.1 DUF6278 family protein [Arthrobacter sp. A2-55]
MSRPVEPDEALQRLPPGMPRHFAEYKPVAEAVPAPPVTNVGGYDELLNYFRSRGESLPRSREGLAAVDAAIDGGIPAEAFPDLARSIGMFYGDVLTHSITGAHWKVVASGFPEVRFTAKDSVDVVHVAQRRLSHSYPSLVENFFHVLEMAAAAM